MKTATFAACLLAGITPVLAGQAPGAARDPDVAISHRDRVYAAEQFSNTVSVTDPADNRLLGVIRLGDPLPANFSPLYRGQVLVHGLGFSPDQRTLAVVSIGSNSVSFIDTQTNTVKHTTYVGRSPHEAFYTPDGTEVWVTVRGEDYVQVLDATTFAEKMRIKVANGPGMQIFSPDGQYGYVCSSFNPDTAVIRMATHEIIAHVKQDSPFCPNIAAAPDGDQVWMTLKDTGRVVVFDGRPPFSFLASIDTGPITSHVNFVRKGGRQFAYVTVGGLNLVKVFTTDVFAQVASIPVGKLPHGIWPSGDGSRLYVGLENDDALAVIDTASNAVVNVIPIGQAPQAIAYVPNAVPVGDRLQGLLPLGIAGQADHLILGVTPAAHSSQTASALPTSVSLFDQGLVQVVQGSVAGLSPDSPYLLALAGDREGHSELQPLAAFRTNRAGAAVVGAVGPIRQIVHRRGEQRRFLVVVSGTPEQLVNVVQVQMP